MRPPRRAATVAALLACCTLPAACGDAGETAQETAADTASALDGLTPEQIQQQAEAMSPAQAESLGIIRPDSVDPDLTVGSPVPTDTALPTPVLPEPKGGRAP